MESKARRNESAARYREDEIWKLQEESCWLDHVSTSWGESWHKKWKQAIQSLEERSAGKIANDSEVSGGKEWDCKTVGSLRHSAISEAETFHCNIRKICISCSGVPELQRAQRRDRLWAIRTRPWELDATRVTERIKTASREAQTQGSNAQEADWQSDEPALWLRERA